MTILADNIILLIFSLYVLCPMVVFIVVYDIVYKMFETLTYCWTRQLFQGKTTLIKLVLDRQQRKHQSNSLQ